MMFVVNLIQFLWYTIVLLLMIGPRQYKTGDIYNTATK